MDNSFVIYLGRQTLETALLALLQAVTSIRDMSLTVVPKLMAVGLITLLCGGWMLGTMLKFMNDVFSHIQTIGQ